jgi:GNAT superfamily N-acetyltransferase
MMDGVFEVRRCADASRAGELRAFAHGIFGALVIDPPSSVLKETEADFVARLTNGACFTVEADGRLIGCVFGKRDGDALYIGRLAVAPDWRRRGVATALIEAAKAEARRIGVTRITLGCRIALTSNVALFHRHGFVTVGHETHAGFSAPTSYDMELRLV